MVDVILLERVEKLGQMGQIVKVKPGFARNYLLPQKKAMRATKENMAYFDTQRAQLEANNLKRKGEAHPVVFACTLLPYDSRFELGRTLAVASGAVPLNHQHCAKFCVLGGGACSRG